MCGLMRLFVAHLLQPLPYPHYLTHLCSVYYNRSPSLSTVVTVLLVLFPPKPICLATFTQLACCRIFLNHVNWPVSTTTHSEIHFISHPDLGEINTLLFGDMELCFMEKLQTQPLWVIVLFAVGCLSVLKSFLAILNGVYVCFLRPGKNLKKYGSWALVTAPTDGIGKGFAFELARKGLNLVLVGRNPDKLKDVSDAIQSKYGKTQIKAVVVDFAGDISEGVLKIREAIEGLDVGVLINNVGVSYPYARFFHEVDDELLKNLIKVNVEGTTKVTQAVLPGMLKRKKGAIVNIGSGAAIVIPSDPLYAVYAATKAYIDQFSRCLYVEYKNSGIDVQCQVPLYVATKMASIRRSSFLVPSSDGYARAAMRWIGYEPRCTPYWPHVLIWGLACQLPECAIDAWRLGFNLKIRKRGQLKGSRKQE